MDLRFSPEENAFRQEVRSFFQTEIPLSIRSKSIEGRRLTKEDMVTAHKTLHKKGWAVYNWPKDWGGCEWTPVQQYIFLEEMQSNGVPPPLAFNTSMNGPVIIQFGTDAQKKKFLPRIAALDDWWCQGFSEPGSGSDLASLKARKPGRRSPSTPIGSSASCARIRARKSSSVFPTSSSR